MNVFVVSKGDAAERDHPVWQEMRKLGHVVHADDPARPTRILAPDVVISMGVTLMDQTFAAMEKWPDARLYCYNWDVYEWVWTRPRAEETPGTPAFLDYRKYGELLRRAHEVWVPSDCTGRRTTQWYGLTNWRRILAWAEPWEAGTKTCDGICSTPGLLSFRPCPKCNGTRKVSNVRDDGYALCCLREIPDPWWGVFERCCEELKIPYKTTRHELGRDEYRDAIEGCRFICAPLYELSTGGLSLLEAYYHGKPVLISWSEWNGAMDYFNEEKTRAWVFKYGDEENFKDKLRLFMENNIPVAKDHREYVATNFSAARFARDVHARITS